MKLVIFFALFTLAACDYAPAIPDEPSTEAPQVPAETYGPPQEVSISSTEVAVSPPEVPEVPLPEIPIPEVPKTPADVELLKPGTVFPFLPPTVNLVSDLVVPHPIPAPFIPERPLVQFPYFPAPAPPPIDIPPITPPVQLPPILPPGVLPPGVLPPGLFPPAQPPLHYYTPAPLIPKPIPFPYVHRPITHHVTTTTHIIPPRINHVYLQPPVLPEIPLLAPPAPIYPPAPLPAPILPPAPLPAPVFPPHLPLPAPVLPGPVFPAPLPEPVFPAPLPAPVLPEPYPVLPTVPVIPKEPTPVVPEPHKPAESYGPPALKK